MKEGTPNEGTDNTSEVHATSEVPQFELPSWGRNHLRVWAYVIQIERGEELEWD